MSITALDFNVIFTYIPSWKSINYDDYYENSAFSVIIPYLSI